MLGAAAIIIDCWVDSLVGCLIRSQVSVGKYWKNKTLDEENKIAKMWNEKKICKKMQRVFRKFCIV